MTYVEFIEKYQPNCEFFVKYHQGIEGLITIRVRYLYFDETLNLYEDKRIENNLDFICTKLDKIIQEFI